MNVALVQLDIAWEDMQRNFSRVGELLNRARPAPGTIVVLPELFACGFSMNVDRVGEHEPRATEAFLLETSRRLGVCVIGGVAARSDRGVSNEAVVTNSHGAIIARYAKLHPFTPAGESEAYVAGDDVVVVECDEFRVAPFVCYDLRFPEIFRRATLRGANLLVVIANWPSSRVEHWITLLRARAIENQAYVIGVNRCGNDPKVAYPGRSIVIEPLGDIVADAGNSETVLQTELDIRKVTDFREKLPFLRDIRDELLGR